MKIKKQMFIALPILSVLSWSAQLNAQELHTLPLPTDPIEKSTIHFSTPLSLNYQHNESKKIVSQTSDEYWFEVSGAELKSGIKLNISAANSLIRISGNHYDTNFDTHRVNPTLVELTYQGKRISSPFKQKVTAEQLATANIFPNSTALTLADSMPTGEYELSVKQPLIKNQRFIINVKEKYSPYKMTMALPSQEFFIGNRIHFTTQFHTNPNEGIQTSNKVKHARKAKLKYPSGHMVYVPINHDKNGLFVEVPENEQFADKPGELYELYLMTESHLVDQQINRNNKIAFSYITPTAKINNAALPTVRGTSVNVDVASEGRYEISAVIIGSDKAGNRRPFMLSRSAYYLMPGQHDLLLAFDKDIMKVQSIMPPFELSELTLTDQSRLQRVSF